MLEFSSERSPQDCGCEVLLELRTLKASDIGQLSDSRNKSQRCKGSNNNQLMTLIKVAKLLFFTISAVSHVRETITRGW